MTMDATYPSLRGRAVFLTGGATGIGAAMVRAFARQGARLAFVDIDAAAGEALAEEIAREGAPRPRFERVDVRDPAALERAIATAQDAIGPLRVLVSNAARDDRHSVEEADPAYWRANLAVNLDPIFVAARAAFPLLRAAGGGSIINFSSITALLGPPDLPVYVAAKAAILGLTKSLARAYGEARVRVNAIVPGWIITERQKALWLTPEGEAEWTRQCALKDRIMPEDVARLALFLASEDSRMITGQAHIIDAGRT